METLAQFILKLNGEPVSAAGSRIRIVDVIRVTVLPQRRGENETEFVAEFNRIELRVDIEDQVHFEGLRLAMKSRHAVELLPFRVNVLHVKYVLEQNPSHFHKEYLFP